MRRSARDRGRRSAAAGVVALGLAACGAIPWDRGDGRINATWTGAEKGSISASAAAVWCSRARTAQLTAVVGDTGIGMLIHPADSLIAGRYPVMRPGDAQSKAPAASIGLRLINPTAVSGYQSQTGALVLEQVESGRISGRFEATARSATGAVGTIRVSGRLVNVSLARGGAKCGR